MAVISGRSSRAILRGGLASVARLPALASSRLQRRDPRLWVTGNIHGLTDSPRYLAEHVHHERPDVRVHWIADNEADLRAARAAGLDASLRGSAQGRRVQRRAGVAIFTHGFLDLDLPLVYGAYLVYLWHGTPLKRIGLDVGGSGPQRGRRVRAATRLVRWAQARAFRAVRLFVAANGLEQERFSSAFAVPRERIPVLGSPRFDVIRGGPAFERVAGTNLRARLGLAEGEHVVLWLPTHRVEYGAEGWLPRLEEAVLERALAGTRVRIVAKPHPLTGEAVLRQVLPEHPRVTVLGSGAEDVNCLLHIADELVTDYSSAVCDFAISGKPVQLFAPDVERYEGARGLYEPYGTLTGGRHHVEWASLLEALAADSTAAPGASGAANVRAVADYCRLEPRTDVCARVTDTILAAVSR